MSEVGTDSEALKAVAMLLKEFIVLRTRLDRIEAFVTSHIGIWPMVLKNEEIRDDKTGKPY